MAEYTPKAVKDVPAEAFIKAYAAHLKANDKLQIPDWVDVVKTATFKELAPYDKDWYYIRAAAVARQVYVRQGLGVGALRIKYGGLNKRKGAYPEHFARASGGLIRHILQQFEEVGFVEKHTGPKGGRRITPAGQKDMDTGAAYIAGVHEACSVAAWWCLHTDCPRVNPNIEAHHATDSGHALRLKDAARILRGLLLPASTRAACRPPMPVMQTLARQHAGSMNHSCRRANQHLSTTVHNTRGHSDEAAFGSSAMMERSYGRAAPTALTHRLPPIVWCSAVWFAAALHLTEK